MTGRTLLDTCVVIDFLRGRQGAIALIKALALQPAISSVSVAETFAGLRSQREERAVRQFFSDMKIVSVDAILAERAGAFLRHYGRSHSMDIPDALIAATAEQHGLTLATLNVKHFPMFDKLKPAY